MFGKSATDLQDGIVVDNNEITGTLKYVTGYTGFNEADEAEQTGNYLALKVETDPEDAVTTVELVGGTKGPVELDEDKTIVLRIADKDSQCVKVVTTSNGRSVSKTYGLSGLTIEDA